MGFNMRDDVSIFLGCTFDRRRGLIINENCVINENCRIDTRGGVEIGRNVSISADVRILTADHHVSDPGFNGRQNSVYIGDYAFIGTGAIILPGIRIERGGVVGAGSVVTRNVKEFSVVAGNPARVIGSRPEKLTYKVSYRRLFH